jgi:hypothetical protein
MNFKGKLKTDKIELIEYYREDIGIVFSTKYRTYFAKTIEPEYWLEIADRPFSTALFAVESNHLYYRYSLVKNQSSYTFKRLNIESKEIEDFILKLSTENPIVGCLPIKKNVFIVYTKDKNDFRKYGVYNSEIEKQDWPADTMESWQRFVKDNIYIYPIDKNQLLLIGYNLNTFEQIWKTPLEPYSRYKENLNDNVYKPGRLSDFIGLFGNELILLVTNQILLAVDITTGVVTWNSEPLTNYFPSFGYKFNAETQHYSFLENPNKQYNIQAIKEAGTLIHTPLWLSSFMVADTDSGYIYAVVEHHILEMNVATKSMTITQIASLLPIPKVREFYKIYFSKGLLYISLSVYSIMPTILTVYNPKTKQFVFIHEFKDSIIDVLFFGDNFYVVGSYGDLYEFER